MSDRVTWEVCPRCGDAAAVGWQTAAPGSDVAPPEVVVEFDCVRGCSVRPDDLGTVTWRPSAGEG